MVKIGWVRLLPGLRPIHREMVDCVEDIDKKIASLKRSKAALLARLNADTKSMYKKNEIRDAKALAADIDCR